MIDCHTHLWRIGEHIGDFILDEAARIWGMPRERMDVSPEKHRAATRGVDGAIVLGFHAPYMDVVVPNDYLAEYVRTGGAGALLFRAGSQGTEAGADLPELRSHRRARLLRLRLRRAPPYPDHDPPGDHLPEHGAPEIRAPAAPGRGRDPLPGTGDG